LRRPREAELAQRVGLVYSIDAEARLVRLDYMGEVSADEWCSVMRTVFRQPQFKPGFGFLADRRRGVTPTRLYLERIMAFIACQRAHLAGSRLALVVTDDAASYGMGRMGEIMAEQGPLRVQVFRDIDQAESWLRLTPGCAASMGRSLSLDIMRASVCTLGQRSIVLSE
jgi:hypothetical protein